jgi:hypothetical protein
MQEKSARDAVVGGARGGVRPRRPVARGAVGRGQQRTAAPDTVARSTGLATPPAPPTSSTRASPLSCPLGSPVLTVAFVLRSACPPAPLARRRSPLRRAALGPSTLAARLPPHTRARCRELGRRRLPSRQRGGSEAVARRRCGAAGVLSVARSGARRRRRRCGGGVGWGKSCQNRVFFLQCPKTAPTVNPVFADGEKKVFRRGDGGEQRRDRSSQERCGRWTDRTKEGQWIERPGTAPAARVVRLRL